MTQSNATGRDYLRQGANLVLAVGQLAAIVLAVSAGQAADLSTPTTAEPPVVPANYAFAIWSFIYPAAIAYALYQVLPARRTDNLLRRTGLWTVVAYTGMTAWAAAVGTGKDWLTVPCIICILMGLVGALVQIIQSGAPRSLAERVFVVVPISVHAGWITVATIANIASVLKASGFSDVLVPDTLWAVGMLIIGGTIGAFVTRVSRGNLGYALTVIWALVGIVTANMANAPGVATVAGVMAVLIAGVWLASRPRSGSGRGTLPA